MPLCRDEWRLGADDGEVDVERACETEQSLGVLGPHRVAVAESSHPGVPRRAVQLHEAGALRELPRERVLATSGPHDEHLHAPGSYSGLRMFDAAQDRFDDRTWTRPARVGNTLE
jgi:hypothetical protein